jgi:hypothetical protein
MEVSCRRAVALGLPAVTFSEHVEAKGFRVGRTPVDLWRR